MQNGSESGNFDELMFWGRVTGNEANYYIAVGVKYKDSYEFPKKTFYWCSPKNDMVFEKMPELNEHWKEWINNNASKPFQGDPALLHEKGKEPEVRDENKSPELRDELESTEEEDPAALIAIPDLTELLRLAFHVSAIDNECSVIPQGAMKLTVAHEVERDEKFKGLSSENIDNIDFYSHFRVVQDMEKRELLDADEAIFRANFLDDLSADKPKGCWSI